MNECMEREIRELLPDVLHGTVVPGARKRIDAHLATCAECRRELETLRAVHGAAVFAPSIDVDRIVRQIPPYGIVTPVVERRAPSRMVGWLVAASLVVVIAGGSSVLVRRADVADTTLPVNAAPSAPAHSLAMTSGVEDLSDGGLVQLITEMNEFDALPTSEGEPVFDVDTTSPIEEDSL